MNQKARVRRTRIEQPLKRKKEGKKARRKARRRSRTRSSTPACVEMKWGRRETKTGRKEKIQERETRLPISHRGQVKRVINYTCISFVLPQPHEID